MYFLFILIAGTLVTGMNYIAYRQLLSVFLPKKISLTCFVFFNLSTLLYVLGLRVVRLPDFLNKIGAICLGVSFMLLCIAIIYTIGHWVLMRPALPVNEQKRQFLSRCFKGAILGAGAGYLGTGIATGMSLPSIARRTVEIDKLKTPLTLVQLTDIHLGDFLHKDFLQAIVDLSNAQHPDIVVITGDIVDIPSETLGDILDPFQQLKARYGVFCVPGNHEYYYGVDGILDKIASLGVTILGNSTKHVAGINITGVYDLAALQVKHGPAPNLEAALEQRNPELPTVLLAHQPKFIEHVTPEQHIDLMISGHTHAGQIFPFSLLVLLDQPYLHGLYRHDAITQVYVGSGAGSWGPPIRFGAPAEIAVLHLTEKRG